MLKRIGCAFAILMLLVSISACSKGEAIAVSKEDRIKYAQENELKLYQGQTDLFFESDSSQNNDLVVATIGYASTKDVRYIGVGLVSISTGATRLAIWRPNAIPPEIGMKVQITRVGYTDINGSANGRREGLFLAEIAPQQ